MAKRRLAWADTLLSNTLSTSQLNFDLLVNAPTVDTITVTRLIGHIVITPATLTIAASYIDRVDVGIQVVSSEAFGAAALPDPDDDADYPARGWLWRDRIITAYANAAGDEKEPFFHVPEVRFDVRAMRKVDKGKLVMTVNKGAAVGSTQDQVFHCMIRALCMV